MHVADSAPQVSPPRSPRTCTTSSRRPSTSASISRRTARCDARRMCACIAPDHVLPRTRTANTASFWLSRASTACRATTSARACCHPTGSTSPPRPAPSSHKCSSLHCPCLEHMSVVSSLTTKEDTFNARPWCSLRGMTSLTRCCGRTGARQVCSQA